MAIDKSRFIGHFKAETKDHIEKINEGILNLEKDPGNTEVLESLMKEAHTVKGSATMMGFNAIAEIAHKMEDGFENAPGQNIQMGQQDYDLLFECLDTIESLLDGTLVRQAKALDDSYIQTLCTRLAQTFNHVADAPEGEVPAPITAPATPVADSQPVTQEAPQPKDAPESPRPEASPCGQERTPAIEKEAASGSAETEPDNDSAQEAAAASAPKERQESIRVDVDKLNNLMNLSGEMLIAKIRLNDLIKQLSERAEQSQVLEEEAGDLIRQLNGIDENISLVVSDIQDQTLSLRMVPVSHLFSTYPRAMRDLANQHGKDIQFEMRGQETHLDKNIIDRMRDPLMHLLRNAVDHGIESPQKRRESEKPAQGTITLSAYRTGSQVVLEISDDGDGIDADKVRERIIQRKLASPAAVEQMTDEQIQQYLFVPGFTTSETVTSTSGRGVGLDVVREEIVRLKATIEIISERGRGTRFIMKLPLTLSITEALLIACGDDVFAIPIDSIVETTRLDLDAIESVEANEVMTLRGQIVPLVRIHQMFSLPKKGIVEKRFFPVVVVQSAEKKLGLLVDEILGHQDIVIKPLGDPLSRVTNIGGGTVLGDGRVVLILDVPAIVGFVGNSRHGLDLLSRSEDLSIDHSDKRILLAEDTPSTAMLEKSVLEAAGFTVHHAKDGQEALEMARRESFDLVISDVLMPRMNGFELTRQLKESSAYKDVPVIVVTTRGSDTDRKRGLDAGADAYILKKDFTSDSFLETIERLLS